jgi:hypothetical protein
LIAALTATVKISAKINSKEKRKAARNFREEGIQGKRTENRRALGEENRAIKKDFKPRQDVRQDEKKIFIRPLKRPTHIFQTFRQKGRIVSE